MKKAIDLQAQIDTSGNHQAAATALEQAFAQTNPGMKLTVKEVVPAGAQSATMRVYIQGEQPAPKDFEATATDALRKAINHLQGGVGVAGAHVAGVVNITEAENDEEEIDVFLPPPGVAPAAGGVLAPLPVRSFNRPADFPTNAHHPLPPQNNFQGCPSNGDGGDPALNRRKNRLDSITWNTLQVNSILQLDWPAGVQGKKRSTWSQQDKDKVSRFEGVAVQLEGFLAGMKVEGPESCNCHADKPGVDYHLWLAADAATATFRDPQSHLDGRARSVVAEVGPRVRAVKPDMKDSKIKPLVDGKTRVRLSGWLMLDQEHADQVGKTRGTIWEIHPIIKFEFQKNGQWVSLDGGN
jgi:hypothetical protein